MPRKVTYVNVHIYILYIYIHLHMQMPGDNHGVRASDTAPGRGTIYVLMSDRGYSFEDTVCYFFFFMGIIIYACTSASLR